MRRKPYKPYSRELKLEAIRLAEVGDKTASQVARELGLRVNQIWKWKQQLEREQSAGGPPKRGRPADDELARLRGVERLACSMQHRVSQQPVDTLDPMPVCGCRTQAQGNGRETKRGSENDCDDRPLTRRRPLGMQTMQARPQYSRYDSPRMHGTLRFIVSTTKS